MPAASLVQAVAQEVPFNTPTEITFDLFWLMYLLGGRTVHLL